MRISVSILSTYDRVNYASKLNKTNMDYLHIDVMDGIFVHNRDFSYEEVIELSNISLHKLDIHLMMDNPYIFISKLSKGMNIDSITIHIEIERDIDYLIDMIHKLGYRVRIALNPMTSIKKVIPYMSKIDGILIMSVNPGMGGQEFIADVLNKARDIRKLNDKISLEIDGGVNNTNISSIKDSGIDTVVVGSYIVKSDEYMDRIKMLKEI